MILLRQELRIMPEDTVERRLAAILAADVVGYSRMMEADEEGTSAALRSIKRDIFEPTMDRLGGRIFKSMGDGFLVEFASVLSAVRSALDVQNQMNRLNEDDPALRDFRFRIGVNLGDVIVEGSDLFGEGVIVASRLEGIAPAGGIAISESVHRQVARKIEADFDDAGSQTLKNIAQPMRVFFAHPEQAAQTTGLTAIVTQKPSIAVLPFTNMSSDPEQDYFADGIVEDIITALCRFSSLHVIARNSSFVYKGQAVDVKRVGRELGVRYVLEGSVRRAGNRVRITGQLIDSANGAHLWADYFNGELEDVFDLQDRVTQSVVGAIAPRVEQAEIERMRLKQTSNLDAYDYYLRGVAGLHQWTREGNREALANLTKAIELDPGFGAAYGNAARCYIQRKAGGWIDASESGSDLRETARLVELAAKMGKDDAVALCTAGMGLAYVLGNFTEGIALAERAIELNPNLAWAWMFSGWIRVWNGDIELAIEHISRAIALSPKDTQSFAMRAGIATGHFLMHRYEEAFDWAMAASREQPNFLVGTCITAASAAMIGRAKEAEKAVEHLSRTAPLLTVSTLGQNMPIQRPEDLAAVQEGLRRAGLRE